MSNSRITTHVLDATSGRPAVGRRGRAARHARATAGSAVAASVTDDDGRVTRLGPDEVAAGGVPPAVRHRRVLRRHAASTTFYPEVVLTVRVADDGRHVHVPLLLSPFAYSTYRGS